MGHCLNKMKQTKWIWWFVDLHLHACFSRHWLKRPHGKPRSNHQSSCTNNITIYYHVFFGGVKIHIHEEPTSMQLSSGQCLVYTCLYNQSTYQYYTILLSHIILYISLYDIIWFLYASYTTMIVMGSTSQHYPFTLGIHMIYLAIRTNVHIIIYPLQ